MADTKPAAFDYFEPTTVEEALGLLERHGHDAKIIAGGQSLIPMMNMRLAKPQTLIDINGIDALSYIDIDEAEVRIGALTRHYILEHSEELKRVCPMLSEGAKLIGHSQIRSRGTIGGSLVHADPTAELAVILSTLGGTVTVASNEGKRVISADELFLTYLTTTIEQNELLVSVQFSNLEARTGHAIDEFAVRTGDFAVVLAAATVTLDEDGRISDACLCVGGIDGVPVILRVVTDELCGQYPEDGFITECCRQIASLVNPEADIHASAEYRKHLCVQLSGKVLRLAIERAKYAQT